jgi:hypothetical protein
MDAVRSFAEDPMAYVPAGPDQERIEDPRFIVTFAPGAHFWSVSVGGSGSMPIRSALVWPRSGR